MGISKTFVTILAAVADGSQLVRVRLARENRGDVLAGLNSAVNSTSKRATRMKDLYSFYHTSDEVLSEIQSLESRCPILKLSKVSNPGTDGKSTTIDVATLKDPNSTTVNRNFFLFGEHARELISVESALHFLQTLCGETDEKDRVEELLRNNEFQIVFNANPNSRRKVENGEYCLRTNSNGVDLNRNWDEKWQPSAVFDPVDTNPGTAAFSESETISFRQLVEAYKPTNFLTIHSGTKGMYMPWAFDIDNLASRNEPEMMQILREVDADHCKCPFGAAGREVGYSCPGTCLDWVYDQLKAPFAFAFEIYAAASQEGALKSRWEDKMKQGQDTSLVQTVNHLAGSHFKGVFQEFPSAFVQVREVGDIAAGKSDEECFGLFNPTEKEKYVETIENWSKAYLDVSAKVTGYLAADS